MNKLASVTRPLMWFMALLLAVLAAGCGGGSGSGIGGGAPILGLPSVVSFAVTPATATIPVTGTQQYTAIATYSDGSTKNVTASSTWTSSNLLAAANPIAGLATGLANGTSTITATFGLKTATATLNVNTATSMSFKVMPTTHTIPVTGTQQYIAMETFSDGTSFDRTSAATWSAVDLVPVGAAGVATITNGVLVGGVLVGGGVATGAKPGTSTITASYGVYIVGYAGVPGSGATVATVLANRTAILTVTNATSVSFKVTPATPSIPVTGIQQYTAIETFSDGTTQDRTQLAVWSAVDLVPVGAAGVATITNSVLVGGVLVGGGVATGAKPGTSTITASYGVYIVGYAGVPGTTDTIASVLAARTSILTVTAATSVSFKVTPATPIIPVTGIQQYTAIETFSDGTTQDRTQLAVWSAVDLVPAGAAGVATITNGVLVGGVLVGGGVATGAKPGTSTITASYGVYIVGYAGVPGTTDTIASVLAARTSILTVTAATSTKFEVKPTTATISINGGTQQFAAIETFSDGQTIDRTSAATWTAVDLVPVAAAGVATITNSVGGVGGGLATGVNRGTSTITASYGVYIAGYAGVGTDTVASVLAARTAVLTVTAPNPGPAGAAPNLGTASTYGIIGNTGITIPSSPLSHIYGDVAITANDAFTGFALAGTIPLPTSIYVTPKTNTATNTGINSTVHGDTAVIPQLKIDVLAAYNDLWNRTPAANALVATQASVTGKGGGTFPAGGTDLSGLVLIPGTYKFGTAAAADTIGLSNAAAGPLVLDAQGNPDAVFVFIASDITTTTNNVILQGGAQAKNVFWVMTATATIGNGGVNIFQGTVLAGTVITVDGTNVQGRMLTVPTIGGLLTISAGGSTITVPQ